MVRPVTLAAALWVGLATGIVVADTACDTAATTTAENGLPIPGGNYRMGLRRTPSCTVMEAR